MRPMFPALMGLAEGIKTFYKEWEAKGLGAMGIYRAFVN